MGSLPVRDRAEIVLIAAEIREAGRTWREVWDFFRRANPGVAEVVTFGQAVERCVEAKRAGNRRTRYIEEWGRCLRTFARGRDLPLFEWNTPKGAIQVGLKVQPRMLHQEVSLQDVAKITHPIYLRAYRPPP